MNMEGIGAITYYLRYVSVKGGEQGNRKALGNLNKKHVLQVQREA